MGATNQVLNSISIPDLYLVKLEDTHCFYIQSSYENDQMKTELNTYKSSPNIVHLLLSIHYMFLSKCKGINLIGWPYARLIG